MGSAASYENASLASDNHGGPSNCPSAMSAEKTTSTAEETRDSTVVPLVVGNFPDGPAAGSHVHLHPSENSRLHNVQENLLQLVQTSSNGRVSLSELPGKYLQAYGSKIPHKDFGHPKLSSFLKTLPLLSTFMDPGGGPSCYIYKREGGSPPCFLVTNGVQDCVTEGKKHLPVTDEEKLLHLTEVQAAAEKLSGSKLHEDMLSFLARYPHGTTGSHVRKNVVGLESFIVQSASETTFHIHPNFLLGQCKGVESKDSDGQKLLFPVGSGRKADCNEIEGLHARDIGCTKSEAIKAAALRLSGTRTHKQVLAFLAQNPDGATGSQITKHVPNFFFYIKKCAEETGEDFFSPISLLSSVEGVSKTQMAGRNLFFINDRKLQGDAIGRDGNQTRTMDCADVVEDRKLQDDGIEYGVNHARTADGTAAVELLGLLEKEYRGRPWPQTKKQLKQILPSLDLQSSPVIVSWLEQGIASDLSESKKKREVIKRAMCQFKQMGCLTGTSKALTWKLAVVQKIIERKKTHKTQSPLLELQAPACPSQPNGNVPVIFVDTREKFVSILRDPTFASTTEVMLQKGNEVVVAIDCEGVPENLFLVQVGTQAATYVFDGVKLGEAELCAGLQPLLSNPGVTKLFHDLHNDALALSMLGGVTQLHGTLDTQLAMESLSGDTCIGFNRMLQQLGAESHPLKQSMKNTMDGGHLFAQRPLPADALEYAALDVSLLLKAKDSLFAILGPTRDSIQRASDFRAKMAPASGGLRQICFDVANSYAIASRELLEELRPQDMLGPTKLEVSDDTNILLDMLPDDLRVNLSGRTKELSDIVLDKGREPIAWINGDRVHLGENDRTVSKEDIDAIVEQLGGFGTDNRAGLEQQLHRISALRNRQQDIIGLTLRVGRHVSGNATMISDLMLADCTQSILFLGEPGSGKTTVVREVTKQLAERFNACIVDTSNEIAGDGDIPHPCVGYARRMMVPSLDKQGAVMVECVQNHTPEVMIIDEIGRTTEVEAARTCKQRGVRLIASAHGDLRKLIKNPKLRGLVGGVETVTLGDAQAKEEAKKFGGGLQKLKSQRAGPPTFDIIVELRRGAQHEWRIILDVGEAVDKVLEGQHYNAQRRTRNPETGALTVALERA